MHLRPIPARPPLGVLGRRSLAFSLWVLALMSAAGTARADELHFGFNQRRLASIDLRGNRTFSDKLLRELLPFRSPSKLVPFSSAQYRQDQIPVGVEALQGFYGRQGFHHAKIEVADVKLNDRGDKLTIQIEEGPRTLVGKVEFRGGGPMEPDELQSQLVHPPGGPAPLDPRDYSSDAHRVRSALVARGYLLAKVSVRQQARADVVDLFFDIQPGAQFRVRDIELEGNTRTRSHLIRRELGFAPGSPFDLSQVAKARADLFATGYFRDVSFETTALDSANATCLLRLHVVERKTAFYEIGVGAGQREPVRVAAGWGERNLFGTGRGITLRGGLRLRLEQILDSDAQIAVLDHQEDAVYVHPRLLGGPFNVGVNAFFRKETRGESGISLERLGVLGRTTLLSRGPTSLDLEVSNQRIEKLILSEVPADERANVERLGLNRATTRSVSLVLTRDSRNDPFQPRQGSLRQVLVQTAGGPILRKDNSFNKVVAEYVHLFPLPGRAVLGLRAKAGWAEQYWHSADLGPAGVPLEDRFFAGGQTTVRGYRENSLGPRLTAADTASVSDIRLLANRPASGGNALLLANAELRFPFPVLSRFGLGLALFADGGNVWETWNRVQLKQFGLRSDPDETNPVLDFRTSVGVGLHYNTPVGPLRLEYALPLRRAQRQAAENLPPEVEPQHLWHFSLGHAF